MIRVSNRNLKAAAVIIYIFTFKFMQLTDVIYPVQSMNYVMAFLALFITIVGIYKQEGKLWIDKDKYNVLAILLLLVISVNNANLKRGDVYDLLYYCISILFFLLLRNDVDWFNPAVKFLIVCEIFYLCCTIFFMINRDFYTSYIVPMLGSAFKNDLLNWSRQNMAAGLFLHYTSNGIEMGLAVGILFYGINNNKIKVILGILTFFALVLTAKRSSFIAAIASLLLIYCIFYCDLKHFRKNGIRNVIVALGLVAIGTVLIVTMDWDITLFRRFITSGDSGRSPIYSAAKDLFTNHILFGTGWDGFRFYYEAKFGTNMDVHNVYLQLLCETGIVGFTVFCLFQVYCLVASIRLLRKSRYQRLSKSENGILRISLYIQLFYHISNYFENLLYSYSTFSIYLIACVIAINLSRKYECKRCNLSNRKEKTVLDAPVAQSLQVKIISLGD